MIPAILALLFCSFAGFVMFRMVHDILVWGGPSSLIRFLRLSYRIVECKSYHDTKWHVEVKSMWLPIWIRSIDMVDDWYKSWSSHESAEQYIDAHRRKAAYVAPSCVVHPYPPTT